ncbi:zinc metallopeptidase [Thiomicrospira sp. WB1]|uniref:zinc metallopeptidase n=1 Tax=Thiomicrospira sp. WB1 TaxID=1685380 RepID=UPI000749B0D5|nr:zinc metallopeptidase [Thiomicrospira sp. WB1]KUJ72626.1 peptidase membrane zinc metallopeptidase [Thiomicrospira sp. WB1]
MAWLIIALIGLFVLTTLPSLYTRHILNKHSQPHPDIPGTGGQFAEHLARQHHLPIRVEITEEGDHYDPIDKVVRLSQFNYHSNSLTAITTAAHEIGHAIQDQQGYAPFIQRTVLVERSQWMQKFSGMALMATPFLIPLMHTPLIGLVTFGAGFIAMGVPVMIHLSTLPVEFDASYQRALPILQQGDYLSKSDLKKARRILWACAMTYVAASLSSLLNLWKWLRALKR